MIVLLFLLTARSFHWSHEPSEEELRQLEVERSIRCLSIPDGAAAMRCLSGEKMPSEPLRFRDDDAVVPVANAKPRCADIGDDYLRWWCFSGWSPTDPCYFDDDGQVGHAMELLRGFDCRTTSIEICFTDERLAQVARQLLACPEPTDAPSHPCRDEPSEPRLLP